MKISYNWLKEYLELDYSPEYLGEILTNIGLEVEGIEHFESVPGSLKGVVVGEVLTSEKHPNADKLSITSVEYGEGPKQIICGAPNVSSGQKVLVATVGTTLHPVGGEPFKIKKAKIRGEESYGMICAEDELGLGNNHDGILVLDPSVEVGSPADQVYAIETDYVFDIGLTPNRSDATSHLGVARDLRAYLKINQNYTKKLKYPSSDNFQGALTKPDIEVLVEDQEGCPRYSGLTISGIEVKESPAWLKNRLTAVGVRPINNIVDITNYVLHEFGQPLHAFDLKEIKGNTILVKDLEKGSKFTTLDGVERTLSDRDLMICDGESNGLCIAGVFGGENSGVTEDTANIFLESAHFNAKRIRVTSMNHILRTDAAMCFEKGSDPSITVTALKRAALMITEIAGGKVSSPVIDVYPKKIVPSKIDVRYERINQLIGAKLEKSQMRDILNALDIEIDSISDRKLTVIIPSNKVDVTREIDVIEEILRIYGFNRIETDNHISYNFRNDAYPSKNSLYNKVSDYLSSNGFYECMALSLAPSGDYERYAMPDHPGLVHVNNTSNVQLDIMRPSMIPSMLDSIKHNQNRQNFSLKFYEFGMTYHQREPGHYYEPQHLILAMTGPSGPDHWLSPKGKQHSFFSLKAMTINIFKLLGLKEKLETKEISDEHYLDEGFTLFINDEYIGKIGRVKASITKATDVKNEVYIADLLWNPIAQAVDPRAINTTEISKFPTVKRDLALEIDQTISYKMVIETIEQSSAKWIVDMGLFDVFSSKEMEEKGKKSYAIYLVFQHPDKTLQDSDVDKQTEKIIKSLKNKLGADLR